jgi:hypothetical protein
MKLWRSLAVALAVYFTLILLYVFIRRFSYPYDLEWMEGGMITHALRLVEHKPIYAAPSLDFIPYLYTPGYPVTLFVLSKLFGLGYALARAVSLLGFFAALILGYVYARREGGDRATAAAAMAIPCAAYVPTGAFYDLARPDSLFLGLVTSGLIVGWWGRRSHAGGVAAALLLIAGFFTKQTTAPFMLALGLMLLAASPRVALSYGLTLAAVGLPLLYWANHASHGWFWIYISKLHRQHGFYAVRAFVASPLRVAALLGPALLLVPWALSRRRSPGLVYATFIGLVGAGAACLSFGTQWAYVNAFMPAIMLPAIAIGTAGGRLVADKGNEPRDPTPARRPAVVFALLALSLPCAAGGLLALTARVAPPSWGMRDEAVTGFDPRPQIPSPAERRMGDALVAKLRAVDGDVLIPFHPFYAHLAGKRTYLHRMGVLDIWRAGMGVPQGLAESFAAHRFALVVMDDKIDGNWLMWPGLEHNYRLIEQLAGPHVVTGAPTAPRYVLSPNLPPAVLDRDREP